MDYLVSCNHLVKIVKVYMLPFCGEIKMNITSRSDDGCLQIDFIAAVSYTHLRAHETDSYLVSCNHLVKIVKVYMLPFCGEIKMNKSGIR